MRSDSHGFALIDTNILYYAFQLGEVEKHRIAQALIEELDAHGEGCLSTQVLLEFSAVVTRKTKDRHDEIARVFSQFSAWTVHQPTPENILAAVALGERCQISIWDSMILTGAAVLGCTVVYTEDMNHNQVIDGIRIVNPFIDLAPTPK